MDVLAFEVSAAGSLGVAVLRVAHDRRPWRCWWRSSGVGYVTEDGVQDRVPLADAWVVRFAFRGVCTVSLR